MFLLHIVQIKPRFNVKMAEFKWSIRWVTASNASAKLNRTWKKCSCLWLQQINVITLKLFRKAYLLFLKLSGIRITPNNRSKYESSIGRLLISYDIHGVFDWLWKHFGLSKKQTNKQTFYLQSSKRFRMELQMETFTCVSK